MEKKRELGPLMPGMVFNTTKLGIIDLPEIGYDRMWEMDEPDENGKIQFWLDDIIKDLKPIPLTPEILRDWFGFTYQISYYRVYGGEIFEQGTMSIMIGENTDSLGLWYAMSRNFNKGETDDVCFLRKDLRYVHELQRLLAGLGLNYKAKINE